jgi:predicted DNA-binding transcriptional regulator AlpA
MEHHTPATPSPQRAMTALYTQADITRMGNFSKSHLYNLIARGHFPQPIIRSGPRFTRWSSVQCDEWFADPAAWIAECISRVDATGASK